MERNQTGDQSYELKVTPGLNLLITGGDRFDRCSASIEIGLTLVDGSIEPSEINLGWTHERLQLVRQYFKQCQHDLSRRVLSVVRFVSRDDGFVFNRFGREGLLSVGWGLGPSIRSTFKDAVLEVEMSVENLKDTSQRLERMKSLMSLLSGSITELDSANGWTNINNDQVATALSKIVDGLENGAYLSRLQLESWLRILDSMNCASEQDGVENTKRNSRSHVYPGDGVIANEYWERKKSHRVFGTSYLGSTPIPTDAIDALEGPRWQAVYRLLFELHESLRIDEFLLS